MDPQFLDIDGAVLDDKEAVDWYEPRKPAQARDRRLVGVGRVF
jgi:hypothetical protein